ncbi:protein phosphatase 2C domain-containing protein [Bradyrhizobium symbiodeficiens]|uniref:PP2C family protein-serine/threonine phosphatase n=1 Tax=Bradyrhizobium symbiodeficiens TaxID=1404367 RepID=UPI0030CABB05
MTPSNRSVTLAAFCGRGAVREQNEDNVSVDGDLISHEDLLVRNLEISADHLVLIADGMGGHARGELASQIALQVIGDAWATRRAAFEPIEAIRAANRAVYDAMADDSALKGMGATIVGIHTSGTKLVWFNLGDSRGYIFRERALRQLTVDHVPRGGTGAARTRTHSVTQSVGGGRTVIDVWPAVGTIDPLQGDLLLLCSDGLTDAVSDRAISQVFEQRRSVSEMVSRLVDLVDQNGSPDNVSLALIQV